MKKRFITMTLLAVTASMFVGCSKPAVETTVPETTVVETAVTEETVATPFLNDLEKYDSVISNLKEDQYYAFADICKDYDVLLVADSVFDNGNGEMESISAKLYGLDENDKVFELGEVSSTGTAYPLAVYDGCLMFGGHHRVAEVFADGGSMITKKDASEEFDQTGAAKYFYFDLDEKFEGEVEDDSKFMAMWEDYEKATIISFTKA